MIKQDNKLQKIEILINSNNEKNHYLAACMIRESSNLSKYKHLLKKIPVNNRVNTLKDVFSELEECMEDIILFKNPKTAQERYLNACILLPKVVSYYNEGWEPDWNNSNEYKYYPWFKKTGLVWSVLDCYCVVFYGAFLPGCLYYKTREKAMDAVKKFESLYNDWLNYK